MNVQLGPNSIDHPDLIEAMKALDYASASLHQFRVNRNNDKKNQTNEEVIASDVFEGMLTNKESVANKQVIELRKKYDFCLQ